MRDRTEGNTMVKVWRQIQENHCDYYLFRTDIYTTLIYSLIKPGGIMQSIGHNFKPPMRRRELPSPRLLRHAFLMSEVEQVDDYRTQILSTFGKVLKFDSTKKVLWFYRYGHCITMKDWSFILHLMTIWSTC